jgi:hypothetical protein
LASFELELSLDGLSSADQLRLEIESGRASLTVGGLLAKVIPDKEVGLDVPFTEVQLRDNPDLPDIYAVFAELLGHWRQGASTLRLYTPQGGEVSSDVVVAKLIEESPDSALRLVVGQTFEVLDWHAAHGGDRVELLGWLRRSTLLYAIDKHELPVSAEPDGALLPVARELEAENHVALNESGLFEITEDGRNHLGAAIAETESYIDLYDVFSDVLYDLENQSARFGTGHGQDLRVPVYDSEGIDSIRAVFLLRLYDSTLDTHSADWTEKALSADLFDHWLSPVLDRVTLAEEDLDWIIEGGLAHSEERAEEAHRQVARRRAVRKARSG